MPTRYGFKLYTSVLYKKGGRKRFEFQSASLGNDKKKIPFIESMDNLLEAMGKRRFVGKLKLDEADPDNDNTQGDEEEEQSGSITYIESWTRSENCYEILMRTGVKNSHDKASGATEEDDVELITRAPSNAFRVFFYVPLHGGKAAFGVESRGAFAPGPQFIKLLNFAGKRIDLEHKEGEQVGYWRFKANQITDPDTVDNYVENGMATGLRFLRYKNTADGRRKAPRDIVLTQFGIPGTKIQAAQKMARGWRDLNRKSQSLPTKEAVAEKLHEFLEIEIGENEFDEAAFEWQAPDGTKSWVSPEDFKDKFTYRLGKPDARPTDPQLKSAIEIKLRDLSNVQELHLDL